MKKIILSLVLCILFIVGCAPQHTQEKVSYKIGAIEPLSGVGAFTGIPKINGMQLAVDEINAQGGINGHKLELNIQDSKLSGPESVTAANYLLNVFNPDIVTVLYDVPAIAINTILKEAKKPMLYDSFSRVVVLDNPYAFKSLFDAEEGFEELTKYLKENKLYTKLGVLFHKATYSEAALKGVKKIVPDVKEYWYTLGDTDFRTILEKAKADGVDRLLVMEYEPGLISLFKSLREKDYGISISCVTASESITPPIEQVASKDDLNKVISIDFIDPNIVESAFADKYRQKYPNAAFTDFVYGAVGYEEVMIIAEAMKRCNPGDSECLLESMKNVKGYKSVIGSKGFKDRVLQFDMTIYKYSDGWKAV